MEEGAHQSHKVALNFLFSVSVSSPVKWGMVKASLTFDPLPSDPNGPNPLFCGHQPPGAKCHLGSCPCAVPGLLLSMSFHQTPSI